MVPNVHSQHFPSLKALRFHQKLELCNRKRNRDKDSCQSSFRNKESPIYKFQMKKTDEKPNATAFSLSKVSLSTFNIVHLQCSGEKSRTRKRCLHFVWNKKSPIQNPKGKWQNAQFLVVYTNGTILLYPFVYNKGVSYFVTFIFGWAFGDAFVSINRNEILTLSFLLTTNNADFEGL